MYKEIEKCLFCEREFESEDALKMHKSAKHSSNISKETKVGKINSKKIKNWTIAILIIGLIFYGIFWGFSNIKTFPPTDMNGHIESNPSSHILKEPMPIAIQKHMLEHADGKDGGRPGVIINYNCEDYECEDDLVGNLESFAKKYDYVYVAPFKNMDAKIVLTKLNKMEILEEYDNEKIEEFIA